MKKRYFFILLIFLIVSLFLFSSNVNYVNAGINDLEYEFDNDNIFYDTKPFSNTTFNMRDSYEYTEHYNATYSFENEVGLKGTNISFVDFVHSYGYAKINETKQNHNEVLYIKGTHDWNGIASDFDSQISGIIEYWSNPSQTDKYIQFILTEGFTEGLKIRFASDGYIQASSNDIITYSSDTWYHFKIDFDCITDTYDIYINGINEGNYNFDVNMDEINKITITGSSIYEVYFDAIGCSWDSNYDIGDNLIPIRDYSNSIPEVDKCEFAYNITNHEPNLTEYKTINNEWIEIDYDNLHIQTSIESEGEISIDYVSDHTHHFGIEKEFDYSNKGIYNISLVFHMLNIYQNNKGFNFNIYTYDDTLLVRLRIALDSATTKIYYYDGSSYIYLYSIVDGYSNDLIFNIYIDSFCILELIEITESYNTYYFPKLTTKEGINTIEFIGDILSAVSMNIYIKSIGLYINGSSYLPHDLSSLTISTNIDNWDDEIHNLFYINADGSFSFSVEYDDVVEDVIFPLTYFNNELKVFHYVESEIFKGSQPYSFLILTNTTYQINTIQVSAVILKQNANEYFMEFDFEGIYANESYFWVSGNRLYFSLNVNQPDDLETINASFNIENVYSSDRSIAFHSDFNGDSYGVFGVNYLGNKSRFFIFPNYPTSKNVILHQGKTIDRFTIYITDNNNNYTYGVSTGYISSISLVYLPDIEFTMLTTTLITMMIPIMIILIPTIVIYARFGKDLVVPMMILMSIICFASGLIPAELFFIIMLGCSFFIIESYRGRD